MSKKKLKKKKFTPCAFRREALEKILQEYLTKDYLDMSTFLQVYKELLKERNHVNEEEAMWIVDNLDIEPASIIQK